MNDNKSTHKNLYQGTGAPLYKSDWHSCKQSGRCHYQMEKLLSTIADVTLMIYQNLLWNIDMACQHISVDRKKLHETTAKIFPYCKLNLPAFFKIIET